MKTESYKLKPVKHKTTKALLGAYPYTYINPDLEKNFPFEPIKAKEVKLVCFEKWMTSEQIEEELAKMGLRGLNHSELEAFGYQHPDAWIGKWGVAAIGTKKNVNGVSHVVYLDGYGSRRDANLTDWVRRWYGGWFFAASPLESSDTKTLSPRGKSEQTLDGEKIELNIGGRAYEAKLKLKK